MPLHLPFRSAAACALALILTVCGVAAASAKTVPANLRIVTTSGKVLAEQTQYTTTTQIKTDKAATCFGPGSGGSGKTVTIPGPTALGLAIDGSLLNRAIKPISVSDSSSFGLAVCGFGGFKAAPKGFWYLKANHKGAQVGGDSLVVKPGDDILWYQSPSFTAPDELVLQAPSFVKARTPFTVQVLRYDDGGKKRPAKGARVPGADLPTGANGKTTVMIDEVTELTARAKGLIPSESATVCITGIGTKLCTHAPIDGSGGADRIAGTPRTDNVKAGAGNDLVNIRDGSFDRVDCGAGRDTAILDEMDKAVSCETKKVS